MKSDVAMKTFVVLPTYNESENIEKMIEAIMKNREIRLIVVDDNSPDRTGKLADYMANEYKKRIHVIHRRERGRGTAGIVGFKYALQMGADLIVEMDADFSHDPNMIQQLVSPAEKYDVVIGSRYIEGGKYVGRSRARILISRGANLLTRFLLGFQVKDWCGGFKCYRAKSLKSLDFDKFLSKSYSIGMEILFRLSKKNFRFIEVPYTFVERKLGKSKFSLKEILNYFWIALKLRILNLFSKL